MKPSNREWLRSLHNVYTLGRLYYTHIRGTELEAAGWTGEKLAEYLEAEGCIEIFDVYCEDMAGSGKPLHRRKYAWKLGKEPKRAELVAHIMKRKVAA